MPGARAAWGIDLGNRALKAVKLVREGGGMRVADFEVIEHEHILSTAGDNRESLIQTALANFIQRHPTKGEPTAISVGGQQSFARFIKLPPVEPKKIPEIVRFEAIQQIPFPLDDVEWSYQLFQDPDSPDVEVGIFAMRRELVNQHISYFTGVELNVQVVQMSPLAVYNAMYFDQRIEGTTMIVDLGAENTDLVIAEGETVWLRSIPVGGNNFTEALAKAFKIEFGKAEELKRTVATSKYGRRMFQEMRPVFADLVAEIQRSIGFYASVHRESKIKKIIALGGTFRLPGLQKYLQQNLQLEVERIDGFTAGAPAEGKLATLFNENLLSSATAYGLALQAMDDAKITSSLLPMEIRREKVWREKTKWFGIAAAMFCLGSGLAALSYYTHRLGFDAQQDVRDKTQAIQNQANKLDSEWSRIEASGHADRQLINSIKSLEGYRGLWINLITDIYDCLPQRSNATLLTAEVEELKRVARNERVMILIDSITTQYRTDMAAVLADPDFKKFVSGAGTASSASSGGFGGGAMRGPEFGLPGMPQGAPQRVQPADAPASTRGFLVTVKCTTPYNPPDNRKPYPFKDAYEMVDKQFVNVLLEKIRQSDSGPRKSYCVERATIVSANKVGNNATRMGQIRAGWEAILRAKADTAPEQRPANPMGGGAMEPGMGGAFGGGFDAQPPQARQAARGAPGAVPDEIAVQDRLAGEDMRDDWEFNVLFAVVLDPAPRQTPQEAE